MSALSVFHPTGQLEFGLEQRHAELTKPVTAKACCPLWADKRQTILPKTC